MAYRWKPSKTQAAEFANKMNNDAEFAAAYQERMGLGEVAEPEAQ